MQLFNLIASTIESLNRKWAVFISFFIIPIMIIILVEVVGRYIFNSPTAWADHLAVLIFGGFIIMGGAYTMMHEGHPSMDLIFNRLPSDRARAITSVITSGLFFLFCGVLLYESIPYCWNATLNNERIETLAWRAIIWPTYWTLPIATFLLLLVGIIKFVRNLRIAVIGEQRP